MISISEVILLVYGDNKVITACPFKNLLEASLLNDHRHSRG